MILAVEWDNNPILGNLKLKFTKPDGTVYKNVVLAGKNGTGKTTILGTIATFLGRGSIEYFKCLDYVANRKVFRIEPIVGNAKYGFHMRYDLEMNTYKEIRTNEHNNPNLIEEDVEDIRHYGVVYSKARSGFPSKKITLITANNLDERAYEMDDEDDFTRLKQLLVDLHVLDNDDFKKGAEEGQGLLSDYRDSFERNCRMSRFKNAFNNFFEEIKFATVDTKDRGNIEILFKKGSKRIPIDDLSTGEKQIVFRGALLLKDLGKLENGAVFIDEPELSLHPLWQKKILSFYQDLFVGKTVQMFFATHSEYIIETALENKNDFLVVILDNDYETIKPIYMTDDLILPKITADEINYIAFKIPSVGFHALLYGYLQKKVEISSIKSFDEYIEKHEKFEAKVHLKNYSYIDKRNRTHCYKTLPTYIRNCVDHPDDKHAYTIQELKESIQLLIDMCRSEL